MRDLAKSMMRLSWGAALSGTEKLVQRLRHPLDHEAEPPTGEGLRDISPDVLSWQTGEQLGPGFREAFQAGAEWQNEWIDNIADALVDGGVADAASSVARLPGQTLNFFRFDEDGATIRQEFRNRFEAYRLVSSVRDWLHLPPPGEPFDLLVAANQALRLDRHRALWAMEGLGHAYAEAALAGDEAPRDLLTHSDMAQLPDASLAMLHAGLGLAFAQQELGALNVRSKDEDFRAAVRRFVSLCEANARPGLGFGSLEALGLIARALHPGLVRNLEKALLEIGDDDLYSHVWHGIGRAIYFAPVHFVPGVGTVSHAIDLARHEAPTPNAFESALVGVGMAATLVNLSHPSVLARLFEERGDDLEMRFFEGLVSAIVLRHDHSPDPLTLDGFLRHQPPDETVARDIWEQRVRRACHEALEATSPEDRALPPSLRTSEQDCGVPFTVGNASIVQLLDDSKREG